MSVVINGRFLTHAITGVQRFAREIVRALDNQLPFYPEIASMPWRLHAPPNTICDIPLSNIAFETVGFRRGHLWEQLDLLRAARNSVLLNFAKSGPPVSRQAVVAVFGNRHRLTILVKGN